MSCARKMPLRFQSANSLAAPGFALRPDQHSPGVLITPTLSPRKAGIIVHESVSKKRYEIKSRYNNARK
jgi:hypothetical protein